MTRPRQRPTGPTAVNPERKAIEDRAREATKPVGIERKGRWPFTAETVGTPDAANAEKNNSGSLKGESR